MIQTSIGKMQVGSPWLARQWINTIPGITATPGISQNNLTIRAGNARPSFTTAHGVSSSKSGGSSSGSGSQGGGWGWSLGWDLGGISIDDGGFTYL